MESEDFLERSAAMMDALNATDVVTPQAVWDSIIKDREV